MKTENSVIERLLKIIPGGVYGLICVGIIIICDFLAILFTPEYKIFENMVSELGRGPGGIFFNLGLILSGIVSIPFYISIAKVFQSEEVNQDLRKIALISSIISVITYVFIGIFPSYPEFVIIYYAHGVLAFVSIATGATYIATYSIMCIKYKKISKFHGYYGFFVVGLEILFLVSWIPITEWIMTIAIVFWIFLMSSYLVAHNNEFIEKI